MDRGETPPGHRRGQGTGQADLIGQQPGRDVPGMGHDRGAVRRNHQHRTTTDTTGFRKLLPDVRTSLLIVPLRASLAGCLPLELLTSRQVQ